MNLIPVGSVLTMRFYGILAFGPWCIVADANCFRILWSDPVGVRKF